ncbi:hypothetical protein KI387_021461, partial [Taxus chinensis]
MVPANLDCAVLSGCSLLVDHNMFLESSACDQKFTWLKLCNEASSALKALWRPPKLPLSCEVPVQLHGDAKKGFCMHYEQHENDILALIL